MVELSKYEIQHVPRGNNKSKALADFVIEFSLHADIEIPLEYALYMDSVSNMERSGMGIVLEGPSNILIKKALKFEITSSNNQAEYEALIVKIVLAFKMGASKLKAKSYSQLVSN